jgi:hypothetical protein
MTSYVFVISPLRSGARTESFDSKLTSLHLFVDAARLWILLKKSFHRRAFLFLTFNLET